MFVSRYLAWWVLTFDREKPLVRMNIWSRETFGSNEPLIERMLWSEWTFDREKPLARMNIWLKIAISPNELLLGDKLRSKNEHLIEKNFSPNELFIERNLWFEWTFDENTSESFPTSWNQYQGVRTNARIPFTRKPFTRNTICPKRRLPETLFARNAVFLTEIGNTTLRDSLGTEG